ncbi:hypothetical protein HK101_000490 [Irineochytrium annulatum]|nr:hypothetical protein HK101_000490 [Irineochytrium annulatum]
MGLATMLFPNSIILLTFQQPFYTPPAVAAVAPIVDKSPQTKAVVKVDPPGPLRVAMQCFGSQATLCGLLILSCRFTKESYRNFGLAMVPYLVFDVLAWRGGMLTNLGAIGDGIGNIVFATCCWLAYHK